MFGSLIDMVTGFVASYPALTAYVVIMTLFTLYRKSLPFPETGGKVTSITSAEQWKSEVQGHVGPVICDFYATWCPPCRTAAPIYGALSLQYPKVKFVKVNVDEVGEVSSAEGIRAMPTFKLYNDGRVETVQGFSENKITAMLTAVAGPPVALPTETAGNPKTD